jgi:hypothetical protein
MSSEAQIKTNRENAQKSTGPLAITRRSSLVKREAGEHMRTCPELAGGTGVPRTRYGRDPARNSRGFYAKQSQFPGRLRERNIFWRQVL